MYQLRSQNKLDIEKAKKYALNKSDKHCYLISEDESALQLIVNKSKLIVDFKRDIIFHEKESYYDAIALKKAIEREER